MHRSECFDSLQVAFSVDSFPRKARTGPGDLLQFVVVVWLFLDRDLFRCAERSCLGFIFGGNLLGLFPSPGLRGNSKEPRTLTNARAKWHVSMTNAEIARLRAQHRLRAVIRQVRESDE